ncbi:hypothetical protein C1645_818642 [Glomus cerebriforme]|uniref:Serine-threonine/tyrosine-protein kinase catalytic domain-containing protein n=1 Tax=Glomus cerebriforme TaxID=658196 RepID=A0A397T6V1_9GLOM|nr:hypothetical protein C1645_818642 [Glomus cerebriforme]
MPTEVLRGNPYTQAADIYSFDGIRPEIYEPEVPKCYIDIMKRCLDSNPDNRPNAIEIENVRKVKLENNSKKRD